MRKFWLVLRQAVTEFLNDHGMKLSASLSYYTIFSIGPVLIIIISLAGIFYGREAVQGKIYFQNQAEVHRTAHLQSLIFNISIQTSFHLLILETFS